MTKYGIIRIKPVNASLLSAFLSAMFLDTLDEFVAVSGALETIRLLDLYILINITVYMIKKLLAKINGSKTM